jgi:hypothetical protein
MKHLNALFGDEVIGMPLGAGFIALTQPEMGDYNFDGVVDNDDYKTWRSSLGNTTGGSLAADGNRNGIVDAADYVVWRKGMADFAQGQAQAASIPEPGTFVLAIVCLLAVAPARRRR